MQVTKLDVSELLALNVAINAELIKRRDKIQASLAQLDSTKPRRGKFSLKGTKVAPKYRGPNGETWAGRGEQPRWLKALVKKGRKIESYRIKQAA